MPLPKPALALVVTAVVLVTGGAAAQPPVVAALRFGGITADPRTPDGIRSLPAGPHAAAAPSWGRPSPRRLPPSGGPSPRRRAGSRCRTGGIAPGSAWGGAAGEAWTAETAFFAFYDADSEDHAGASRRLDWLAAHRTGYGSLPEQVNARGQPASVAPLAWTDAIVLLALAAQRHPLQMP